MTRLKRLVKLLSALPENWPEPNSVFGSSNGDACEIQYRTSDDRFLNVLCGIHNFAVGNNDGVLFFSDSELPKVVDHIGQFLNLS